MNIMTKRQLELKGISCDELTKNRLGVYTFRKLSFNKIWTMDLILSILQKKVDNIDIIEHGEKSDSDLKGYAYNVKDKNHFWVKFKIN